MPLRKIITLYSSPSSNIGAQKWGKLYYTCFLLILCLPYSNFHVKWITCMLTIGRKIRTLLPLDNVMPKALPQQPSWHYLCREGRQSASIMLFSSSAPTPGMLRFSVRDREDSVRLHSYTEVRKSWAKLAQWKKGYFVIKYEMDGIDNLTGQILVCSGNDLQLADKVRQRMFHIQVIISYKKSYCFPPGQLVLSFTPVFTIFFLIQTWLFLFLKPVC